MRVGYKSSVTVDKNSRLTSGGKKTNQPAGPELQVAQSSRPLTDGHPSMGVNTDWALLRFRMHCLVGPPQEL